MYCCDLDCRRCGPEEQIKGPYPGWGWGCLGISTAAFGYPFHLRRQPQGHRKSVDLQSQQEGPARAKVQGAVFTEHGLRLWNQYDRLARTFLHTGSSTSVLHVHVV